MAKPTKHAPAICAATTVAMGLGVAGALLSKQSLWAVAGLLPATAYEVYRTEGDSTRWASWTLLVTLLLEGALLALGVDWDLAELLGRSSETVAGYEVPLGPVTVVGPLVMAVVSVILMARTRGRYTRWLAGVILLGAGALIYILDPSLFGQWFRHALDLVLRQLR